jgi:protein gp37
MSTMIAWTNETWNPVTGCTKVSAGCKFCYAEAMTERFGGKFSDVVFHPERLDAPLHWRKPSMVFVNSMSDLFHERIPGGFIFDVLTVIWRAKRHTFQVLTKRPERMREVMEAHYRSIQRPPLENLWLGVSAENQETADERIPFLLQTPAAIRFTSLEPLLGPVDFRIIPEFNKCGAAGQELVDNFWVIVGGESGPHARPMNIEWLESIVDQCQIAGVPVFVKQDNGRFPGKQGRIPDRLWIKQFPEVKG